MARYDSLTGLPNRAYFHEFVTEALATGDRNRLCGIAVLDLDDFKSVNDTLGHPIGDGLIYAIAEKLAAFASDTVRIGRFGGDEFVIFFDRVEDESHLASMLGPHLRRTAGRRRRRGPCAAHPGQRRRVLSRVKDTDVDGMIVKADLALYKAKELGKNNWRQFESAMDAAFRNRQLMKADLRTAIEVKSLRVVYPADRIAAQHADSQLRGALPLGAPRSRTDLAGHLHPASRGDGHHLRDQRFHATGRMPRMRKVAGTHQRIGEPVGAGLPQSRHRRPRPRSAAGSEPAG